MGYTKAALVVPTGKRLRQHELKLAGKIEQKELMMGNAKEEQIGQRKKTILVVDDETGPRESLKMILKPYYNVITAERVEIAWEEYQKAKPDLVTVDLKMPGMSGLTLLRRIREQGSLTPCIIITGYGSMDTAIEGLELGAYDYLAKPFDIEHILNVVAGALSWDSAPFVAGLFKARYDVPQLAEEHLTQRKQAQPEPSGKTRGKKYIEECKLMVGSTLHDLRGEFVGIGTALRLLRKGSDFSTDVQAKFEMIERSLEYSNLLLKRLFDYLNVGKLETALIDAGEVLRKTEALLKPRLPAGVELKLEIQQPLKQRVVSGREEHLMGVLLELVHNAIAAMGEKGGDIELRVEGRNGSIVILVKDKGPGIPIAARKKVFKKQTPSTRGLGMGLYLSHRIVRLMGGKLKLEASSKKGTTFAVVLPVASDKKEL